MDAFILQYIENYLKVTDKPNRLLSAKEYGILRKMALKEFIQYKDIFSYFENSKIAGKPVISSAEANLVQIEPQRQKNDVKSDNCSISSRSEQVENESVKEKNAEEIENEAMAILNALAD